MKLPHRAPLLLLPLLAAFLLTDAQDAPPAITSAPHDAPPLTLADRVADRRRAHATALATGQTPAFIVVLRGEDLSHSPQALSVRINGRPAEHVLLHNDTAFSFAVPAPMVLNENLLSSSMLQIRVGGIRLPPIPLVGIEQALTLVDVHEYRETVLERRAKEAAAEESGGREVEAENLGDSEEELVAYGGHGSGAEPDSDEGASLVSEEDTSDAADEAGISGEEDEVLQDALKAKEDAELAREKLVSRAAALLMERERASTWAAVRVLERVVEEGDAGAMTVLGSALLSGVAPGMRRDMARAVKLLESASQQGYADAQAVLGFLYASGIAGTALRKDIGAAVLMWTFAAEGGSMYAKMALGYRYFTGTDIPEDCEKASEYYNDVADEVFRDSRTSNGRIGGLQEGEGNEDDDSMAEIRPPTPSSMLTSDRKRLTEGMTQRVMGEANELVQYYRHSADRGDAQAQVVMGNLYYYGAVDMPQDIDRARELFEQAASAGRAVAHAHLGYMDLQAGKNDSAVFHLKKAAERGDRLGLHGMGFAALHGIGIPKNEELAASYFLKAAEKEHPDAMFNLAIMYSKGIGVPKSSQEAFRYYQTAARFGHMPSNYNVGIMMLRGLSPAKKDCTMATQYLKLVAQQGIWNKILSMAFRAYEKGAYADALFRYLQAAHAGIELAQFNAAFMYEHNSLSNNDGLGLKAWGLRDRNAGNRRADRSAIVEEAMGLYQMSASQGHSDSMVRMGDLAFGAARDFTRAASAYDRAVKLGNAEAMFNLGWMHARGFGLNADKHMAKRYFDQAKETDSDAILPATIAVYSLQYSESIKSCLDRAYSVFDRVPFGSGQMWDFGMSSLASASKDGDEKAFQFPYEIADAIALVALLIILVVVLAARRRRLRLQRLREDDGGGSNVANVSAGLHRNLRSTHSRSENSANSSNVNQGHVHTE